MNTPKTIYSPFTPPFYLCGIMILDATHRRVADLRGWGFLTGKANACALEPVEAEAIQTRIGNRIVELMNKDAASPTITT